MFYSLGELAVELQHELSLKAILWKAVRCDLQHGTWSQSSVFRSLADLIVYLCASSHPSFEPSEQSAASALKEQKKNSFLPELTWSLSAQRDETFTALRLNV